MPIAGSKEIISLIFGKKVQLLPSLSDRQIHKFYRDHTQIGHRETRDRRDQLLTRTPIWRYHGWEEGHRYTGARLREIRATNGVGRPPK